MDTSFRKNYGEHGVVGYYEQFGSAYVNPREEEVTRALLDSLKKWTTSQQLPPFCYVLDLAAGSGEATLILKHWGRLHSKSKSLATPLATNTNATAAADGEGDGTKESRVLTESVELHPSSPLVAGEAWQARLVIDGCDPYTYAAYEARVGVPCSRVGFEDIEAGALDQRVREQQQPHPLDARATEATGSANDKATATDPPYDVIVCSFALHLLATDRLFSVCLQMAIASRFLIIISPHKRPHIKPDMGWILLDDNLVGRVKIRLYCSAFAESGD